MVDADATQARSTSGWQGLFAVGEIVAGNYLVLGHAGKGGMGVVYRARDLKLERTVALKFLPDEVTASEREKQRFLQEAKLAAALDHPNIGAIYGIDKTSDGRAFIVMAFYEGPSLAVRVHQGGPMKLSEVLDVAKQMARGLGEAHSHNIIHRDIKPSNVMFAGSGLVKIVDFGLAYASEQSATLTHGAVGTVGYMPPEQALNRGTDQRADIWALGVVMAEMLTGRNPFQRESLSATVLAVVNEAPASLEGFPLELQQIVYRALSKNRLNRYQSCAELLHDLEKAETVVTGAANETDSRTGKQSSELRRSWEEASKSALHPDLGSFRNRNWIAIAALVMVSLAGLAALWFGVERGWRRAGMGVERNPASDVPQPAVLAVLPFAGGADARLNALGQGLMESVGAKLSGLSENRSLEVIPARILKEKALATAADAHRQFGANVALSANLEPSGDLVKVSYTLQNINSGGILGSHTITVPLADVFAAENEVLDGTVQGLQLKLRTEEQTALKVHGTANPEAYDYYLQARGYLLDYTKLENVENALLMSRGALRLDSNFGSAKAILGEAYWRKYRLTTDQHLAEQAKEECGAAIALGNASAAGHICLGLVYGGTGLYRDSAAQYQLAIELEPGNESAAIGLASALERQGAVSEAAAAYQMVIDAHPQSYFAYNAMGGFCYRRSEYDKAVQLFKKVTELAPENYAGYVNLGGTYNDQSRFLEAIEPLKKSIALRASYGGYTNLGTSYLGLHKLKEAADAYQEAVKIDPKQYVTWGNLASAQNYSGAKEQALISYRKAIALASEELKVNPRNIDVLSDLAVYYASMGDKEQSLKYMGQALQYGHSEKELLATAAQVYNQLGDTGTALEWMTKAINAGYSARKFQDLVAFQNLVDNPRYQEIVSKGQHPQ